MKKVQLARKSFKIVTWWLSIYLFIYYCLCINFNKQKLKKKYVFKILMTKWSSIIFQVNMWFCIQNQIVVVNFSRCPATTLNHEVENAELYSSILILDGSYIHCTQEKIESWSLLSWLGIINNKRFIQWYRKINPF